MKNYLLFLTMSVISLTGFAQFGVSGGYVSSTQKYSDGDGSVSFSGIDGFNLGVTYTLDINDTFQLRPEVHFVSVSYDGESMNGLLAPIPVLYGVGDAFTLQFGPTLGLSLEESSEDYTNFALGAVLGVSYAFNDSVYGQLRYLPQLSNSYTGGEDFKVRTNTPSLSIGYNF